MTPSRPYLIAAVARGKKYALGHLYNARALRLAGFPLRALACQDAAACSRRYAMAHARLLKGKTL